jgi:hypothetical protein
MKPAASSISASGKCEIKQAVEFAAYNSFAELSSATGRVSSR